MRIGIMTGGGDAPGLNGVIEAVTKNLTAAGIQTIGIEDGFEGIYDKNTVALDTPFVDGIHKEAGTILGTSNKRGIDDVEGFIKSFKTMKLEGLIVAGGDGTFKALSQVSDDVKIIGIPKTIDNDLSGTDLTFGHTSACHLISSSISALKNSADAHKRIMVLECMGRTAGWLALNGGLAGYADAILIPEVDVNLEHLSNELNKKIAAGKRGLVVAISEGVKLEGKEYVKKTVSSAPETKRLGGVSSVLAESLEENLGMEARNVVLGHLQRSQTPTVFDRLMTLKLGCEAAKLAKAGKWNRGISYLNGKLISVPLEKFCDEPRLIRPDNPMLEYGRSLDIII